MHANAATLIAILSFTSSVSAAVIPPSKVVARETAAQCTVAAHADNYEYVQRRRAQAPVAGGGGAIPISGNSEEIVVGVDKNDGQGTQWVRHDTTFNVWNTNTQHIHKDDTGLTQDIGYRGAGTAPTFGCQVQWDGNWMDCEQDSDVTLSLGSSLSQTGVVVFPCSVA